MIKDDSLRPALGVDKGSSRNNEYFNLKKVMCGVASIAIVHRRLIYSIRETLGLPVAYLFHFFEICSRGLIDLSIGSEFISLWLGPSILVTFSAPVASWRLSGKENGKASNLRL